MSEHWHRSEGGTTGTVADSLGPLRLTLGTTTTQAKIALSSPADLFVRFTHSPKGLPYFPSGIGDADAEVIQE